MKIEVGKNYKHSGRGLYVRAVGDDPIGHVFIEYSDGRRGMLIENAPGWEEISDEEWLKIIEKHRKESKTEGEKDE